MRPVAGMQRSGYIRGDVMIPGCTAIAGLWLHGAECMAQSVCRSMQQIEHLRTVTVHQRTAVAQQFEYRQ